MYATAFLQILHTLVDSAADASGTLAVHRTPIHLSHSFPLGEGGERAGRGLAIGLSGHSDKHAHRDVATENEASGGRSQRILFNPKMICAPQDGPPGCCQLWKILVDRWIAADHTTQRCFDGSSVFFG